MAKKNKPFWELGLNPIIMKRYSRQDDEEWIRNEEKKRKEKAEKFNTGNGIK